MEKRDRGNYAILDYTQRLEIIEDSAWKTNRVLVEWKEVRIADICFQTLLKIQTPTNATQQLPGGKSNATTPPQTMEETRI